MRQELQNPNIGSQKPDALSHYGLGFGGRTLISKRPLGRFEIAGTLLWIRSRKTFRQHFGLIFDLLQKVLSGRTLWGYAEIPTAFPRTDFSTPQLSGAE